MNSQEDKGLEPGRGKVRKGLGLGEERVHIRGKWGMRFSETSHAGLGKRRKSTGEHPHFWSLPHLVNTEDNGEGSPVSASGISCSRPRRDERAQEALHPLRDHEASTGLRPWLPKLPPSLYQSPWESPTDGGHTPGRQPKPEIASLKHRARKILLEFQQHSVPRTPSSLGVPRNTWCWYWCPSFTLPSSLFCVSCRLTKDGEEFREVSEAERCW